MGRIADLHLARRMFPRIAVLTLFALLAGCATKDRIHTVRVSVPEQKMVVYKRGVEIARYDVSTSKFGLGDRRGSNCTPLGQMEIARKIGGGQRLGMKFKHRRPTGEVVRPNTPGRDPIVTRILWLRGLEERNRNTYRRTIYIHGTAEEWKIGTPASYGCIRMRSRDVVHLYQTIGEGAKVEVTTTLLPGPYVRTDTASVPPAL